MRRLATAALVLIIPAACRPYDYYAPIADQGGLVPAEQFAKYGREQAELMAIGRALAEWKMTADEAGATEQVQRAACFARRFPDVAAVDLDPLGHRLTVRFTSGWRAAVVPVTDGVDPAATPGISPLGPSTCT